MGGFICVALIVIALVWTKLRAFLICLKLENDYNQGGKDAKDKK